MLPIFQFAVFIFCAAIFSAYPFPFGLVIFTPLSVFAALYNKHTLPINHIAFSLCASLCFSVIHVVCHCSSVCVLIASKCLDNSKTTNTSFSVNQCPSKFLNPFLLVVNAASNDKLLCLSLFIKKLLIFCSALVCCCNQSLRYYFCNVLLCLCSCSNVVQCLSLACPTLCLLCLRLLLPIFA